MLSSHTSKIRKMPKCCLNPGMQCKQMLSTHTQRQDRMPKCCPNYPNPGRGCQARPHFGSARFAHFSRIPHFCRVSLFRWISAGFGKFGEEGVAGGQQCNIQGSSSALKFQHCTVIQFNTIQVPFEVRHYFCKRFAQRCIKV